MKRKDISSKLEIQSCLESHESGCEKASYEIIYEKTKAHLKVIYAAMKRDYSKGFIECGVSLRTAWPTKNGINFLNSEVEV